jgi:putative hydrolase of the HAD superfamily
MTASVDWNAIRLVVFDVDGTLYDQRALRSRMLRDIAIATIASRSLTVPLVLRPYRKLREAISEAEVEDFEDILVERTAAASGVGAETVRGIVADWMETRPLAYLRACRYPHVDALFAALKGQGKIIGIYSDYPALAKLRVMGLPADHVVTARDPDIRILKPHPRGLECLMRAAKVSPAETVLVGDRLDRDGEAARRAGVTALIRSGKPLDGCLRFSNFADPVFAPLLGGRADTLTRRPTGGCVTIDR